MMTADVVSQARALVRHLEREQQAQVTVNELYQKLVNLLTEQMDKHIPFRVRPTDKHISHKPHSAEPWWTPEVSQSWEQVRQAEKSYLRAQGGQRRILRARYIKRHRLFSKQLHNVRNVFTDVFMTVNILSGRR